MKAIQHTISTIFFLPLLNVNPDEFNNNGFVDAYINDPNCSLEHKDCLFVLFRPVNNGRFNSFVEEEYTRTPSLIDDYDYDEGYCVLVYKLPVSKFSEDFELIKKGKYSKVSENFKKQFKKIKKVIKNGLHKDEIYLQHLIFEKSEILIDLWYDRIGIRLKDDMEVWEGWDEEKETLNIENLKLKEV